MTTEYILKESEADGKKFALVIKDTDGKTKTVNFGSEPYSDMTQHKNPIRRQNYLSRHSNEQRRGFWRHTPRNLERASYLSRWILWNKPSLDASIKVVEQKQGINIQRS